MTPTTTQTPDAAHSPTRRYSRVNCNAAAVMTAGATTVTGVCENISIGGAYFKGSEAPPVGPVVLTLCLPSMGPIELSGEVCHTSTDACGIRFTNIPRSAFSAICAYVGTRL